MAENDLAVEEVEAEENDLAVEEVPEEDDNIIHFAADESEADTTSVEVQEPEGSLFRNISVSSSDPIVQSAPIPEPVKPMNPADVAESTEVPDYEEIDNIDSFVLEHAPKGNDASEDDLTMEDEEDIVVIDDSEAKDDGSSDELEFEFDIDMLTSGVAQPLVTDDFDKDDDYDDSNAISIDDLT